MALDTQTLHRILQDVAGGRQPDDSYTDEMRAVHDRTRSDLSLAKKKNPKIFLHIPPDGQDGMPEHPGDDERRDYSDDEARDESGKWTSGGGSSTSPATSSASPEAWTKANPKGNAHVYTTAQAYLAKAKLPAAKVLSQQALSEDEGKAIASSYDAAQSDPDNKETQAAYKAFNAELAAQRAAAEAAGYKFEAWDKPGQPYATSKEMMADVAKNKHLYYFKSTEGTTPNKLMTLEQNDTFRAVHDLFGHAMGGNQFGPKGETNAFLDHVQMFGPDARKALATETVGQNAWFNFSKENEGKPVTERRFADQKAFLLDPKLYQPLIDRAVKHSDATIADDGDLYHHCPCHRHVAYHQDYSDDQPRDENGRWTSGGGGGGGAGPNSVIRAAEDMNIVQKYADKFPQIKKLPGWQNNPEVLKEAKAYMAAPKMEDFQPLKYNARAEEAKAQGARAQGEVEYRQQMVEIEQARRQKFYNGKDPSESDVGLRTAQKQLGMMENNNLEAFRQERLAATGSQAPSPETIEGLQRPSTLEGQEQFPGRDFMNAQQIAEDDRLRGQVARVMRNAEGDALYDAEGDLRYYANNGNKYAEAKLAEIQAQNLAQAQGWAARHPEEFGPEAEKKYIEGYINEYPGRDEEYEKELKVAAKAAWDRNMVVRWKAEAAEERRMNAALADRARMVAEGKIPMKPLPGEETKYNREQAAAKEEEENKWGDMPESERDKLRVALRQEERLARKEDPNYVEPVRRNYNQEGLDLGSDPADARLKAEESLERRKNEFAEQVMGHPSVGESEQARAIGYDRIEKAKEAKAEEADRKAKETAFKIPMRPANEAGLADMEKNSEVQSVKSFKNNNTSDSYRAVLPDGSFAMWKPAEGEEGDLRDNIDGGTYYLREAASAKVAGLFGVSDMMPATVVGHDKEGREGTLQSWAVGAKPLGAMEDDGDHVMFDRGAAEKMRVFDYVSGNSDRHNGNVMVKEKDGKQYPVMIDNGLSFPKGAAYRILHPYDYVPRDDGSLLPETHAVVEHLDLGKMAKVLHDTGIEREAATAAVQRGLHLQADPDMLSTDRASGSGAYAWDDIKDDDLDEFKDRAEAIVKEHYK